MAISHLAQGVPVWIPMQWRGAPCKEVMTETACCGDRARPASSSEHITGYTQLLHLQARSRHCACTNGQLPPGKAPAGCLPLALGLSEIGHAAPCTWLHHACMMNVKVTEAAYKALCRHSHSGQIQQHKLQRFRVEHHIRVTRHCDGAAHGPAAGQMAWARPQQSCGVWPKRCEADAGPCSRHRRVSAPQAPGHALQARPRC